MSGPGPFAAAIARDKEQLDKRRQSKKVPEPWCVTHNKRAPHVRPGHAHCCALDAEDCVIEWRAGR